MQRTRETKKELPSGPRFFSLRRDSLADPELALTHAKFLYQKLKTVLLDKKIQELKLTYESPNLSVKTSFPDQKELQQLECEASDFHALLTKLCALTALPFQIYLYHLLSQPMTLATLPHPLIFFGLNQKTLMDLLNEFSQPRLPDIRTMLIKIESRLIRLPHRERGETKLTAACKAGNKEAVRFYLNLGLSANNANDANERPLQIAFDRQHEEIMELLIYFKANIKELKETIENRNAEGHTLLMRACQANDIQRVRCLLRVGARVQDVDSFGRTPLMLASERGSEELIKLLLKKDSNVNASSDAKWTALMHAAKHGNKQAVRLLLDSKADAAKLNGAHCNALELAKYYKHQEVVELLEPEKAYLNYTGFLRFS